MKNPIHVKPAQGLRVVDPATGQPLPEEGKNVEAGVHWTRREQDGDVTVSEAKAEPAEKTSKK